MYDHKTFSEILNRVQKAVDDLNLHSYSNLPIWVNKLDMEVGWCWLHVTFSAICMGVAPVHKSVSSSPKSSFCGGHQ